MTPIFSVSLQEVELGLRLYEELTNREPRPFNWESTKYDLFDLLQRLPIKSQTANSPARPTITGE